MQFNRVTGFSPSQLLVVAVVWCSLYRVAESHEFAYGVNSPSTGDVKDQQESKIGHQTVGYYRLLDADGMTRTVNYNANPRTGFQATVTRELAPGLQRTAALPLPIGARATSYHQQTRAMSGFRYDTAHPSALPAALTMPSYASPEEELTMPYPAAAAADYGETM